VSTVNIHGTSGKLRLSPQRAAASADLPTDPLVPFTGDPVLGFPPIPTNFQDWATRNKCVGQPVSTFSNGPFSNQIYTNCSDGSVVELVVNKGGGHEWPINQYFNTTAFIAQFFDLL
jgi:poly(3-hydroxybutyrate) depolymerase